MVKKNSNLQAAKNLKNDEFYTTYETVETTPVLVIKNGGNREAFDPGKIKSGIIKACEKRPVPMYKIDKLVEDVQKQVYNTLDQDVTS